MVEPSVYLVDEAVDVTANEAHYRLVGVLRNALGYALLGRAAVLADIFLRVDEREQVAPDVLVAPGVKPGSRKVYAVPGEPVPTVTLEVRSQANRADVGRALLEAKRSLLGRIGVGLHLEIDPDDGFIAVWQLHNGALTRTDLCTAFSSDALGGVRIETPAPGIVRVLLPNGREVLDGDEELVRSERLAAKLRELGVDPDEAASD